MKKEKEITKRWKTWESYERFLKKQEREARKEAEADAFIRQRQAEYIAKGGVIPEARDIEYRIDFDCYWEALKFEYTREELVEIAGELVDFLLDEYPEIGESKPFKVTRSG
jgi:hypothetical protein